MEMDVKDLFEHVVQELSEMKKELREIRFDTHENTLSLQEHIRRTEALETYVKALEVKVVDEEKLRLATDAVNKYKKGRLELLVKVLTALAAISTLIFGFLKFKGIM